VKENGFSGVAIGGGEEGFGILINYNNFEGNVVYGVESWTTDSSVDATLNWWGNKRGPSRARGKAKGHDNVKGDRVSPNVKFAPWLRAPLE